MAYIELTNKEAGYFWGKIDKSGTCWTWMGAIKNNGYGVFRFRGKATHAHKLMYCVTHNDAPVVVCHSCDNRACVNPGHLTNSTQKKNLAEMRERGRAENYGSRHGMSKLMEADVLNIRELGASGDITHNEIAIRFGVSRSVISAILRRDRWTHI